MAAEGPEGLGDPFQWRMPHSSVLVGTAQHRGERMALGEALPQWPGATSGMQAPGTQTRGKGKTRQCREEPTGCSGQRDTCHRT